MKNGKILKENIISDVLIVIKGRNFAEITSFHYVKAVLAIFQIFNHFVQTVILKNGLIRAYENPELESDIQKWKAPVKFLQDVKPNVTNDPVRD